MSRITKKRIQKSYKRRTIRGKKIQKGSGIRSFFGRIFKKKSKPELLESPIKEAVVEQPKVFTRENSKVINIRNIKKPPSYSQAIKTKENIQQDLKNFEKILDQELQNKKNTVTEKIGRAHV